MLIHPSRACRLLAASVCSVATPGLRRDASSKARWKQRQAQDSYAREAKVQGLKSRAAFKLLELDAKYKLFAPGQTVLDLVSEYILNWTLRNAFPVALRCFSYGYIPLTSYLKGYAPGSWSQVAVEMTRPHGQVVGVDLLPVQPPHGIATFQGDCLSPDVQQLVKKYLRVAAASSAENSEKSPCSGETTNPVVEQRSYIDCERRMADATIGSKADTTHSPALVDYAPQLTDSTQVVLSDMSEPWEQTAGFFANSLSNPYRRLMNTSGNAFRDHAGSMDLCNAALSFATDTLKTGGSFVCKFYQGAEDKELRKRLRTLFAKVHVDKPKSSRSGSKEAYFVALRRKADASKS